MYNRGFGQDMVNIRTHESPNANSNNLSEFGKEKMIPLSGKHGPYMLKITSS